MQGWYEERKQWLMNMGISKRKINSVYEKQHFAADAFVDDKYENVVSWKLYNEAGLAIVFDRPWNAKRCGEDNKNRIVRVFDYEHLQDEIAWNFK